MSVDEISYDPSIIRESARRLYSRAASIISWTAFLGVLVGGIAGLMAVALANQPTLFNTAALFGAVIGGILGYMRGRTRAFELRLEAQLALCQVQIAINTSSGAQ